MSVIAVVLLAVSLVACDRDTDSDTPSQTGAPTTTSLVMAVQPPDAPLPPPEVLTDVLYKLSDTAVPGDQKANLVEGATADNAAQLDKFGKALQDSAYTPLGFTAENIAWAAGTPGSVTADVTVHSENPNLGGGFTFPMEFIQTLNGWQLSRRTADIFLTLGQNPTPTG